MNTHIKTIIKLTKHICFMLAAVICMPAMADNINGKWSAVGDWPFVAIHAAVLPDGRVVTYGSDGPYISTSGLGGKGRTGAFLYDVWDPTLGLGAESHSTLPNETGTDLFCSQQILLPDTGELLIAGGDTYETNGTSTVDNNRNTPTSDTNLFSPDKVNDADRLTNSDSMLRPRWYATSTMMPNGDIFLMGGKGGADRPEVRTRSGQYQLKSAINTSGFDYWYPRNFLAPDGRIFGYDVDGRMYYISLEGEGSLERVGTLDSTRYFSSAVMYAPGKILEVSAVDNSAVIIDINSGTPVITPTSPLSGARKWLTLTLLPDGKVLATGGSQRNSHGVAVGNVGAIAQLYNTAEIWDPETEQWHVGSEAQEGRLYHSTAILLHDGTVLTAGGGLSGPFTQHNGEVYYPPYLYDSQGNLAARPEILAAPESADYGEQLSITVDDAQSISRLSLVKLGSVTHSFNVEQRIIVPEYTVSGQNLVFNAPTDARLASPGYYMIFVFDTSGVPSVAKTILIDGDFDTPAASTEYGVVENAGIPGYNREVLRNQSLQQCQAACTDRDWCLSVDLNRSTGTCYLQPVRAEDVSGGLRTNYPGNPYDHYFKLPEEPVPDPTPAVTYTAVLNAGIPGYNREVLRNQSLQQCQTACTDRDWCLSVDLNRSTGTCYLQPVRAEDVSGGLRTNYPGNPYDHYFKDYN